MKYSINRVTILATTLAITFTTFSAAPWKVEQGCIARELNVRDGIARSARKLAAGGNFTIAYLGGSITMQHGWRVKYTDYLQSRYPQSKVKGICAGLAGTGSSVGVFRMDEQVLKYKPDLMFVEFATNDTYIDPTVVSRGMEGIVRKMWKHSPETDIVFVYTIADHMTNAYLKGVCPRAATMHEKVADYYGVPSICFGVRVAELLKCGKLVMSIDAEPFPVPNEVPERSSKISELLKQQGRILFANDGTHPVDAGHGLYLKSFVESFDKLIAPKAKPRKGMAKPLDPMNYEKSHFVPIDKSLLSGAGWQMLDKDDARMKKFEDRMGPIWMSKQAGDSVKFKLRGTSFGVWDLMGPDCCRVETYVDGKKVAARIRCSHWTKKKYLLLPEYPFGSCEMGEHEVEMRIVDRDKGATAFLPSRLMIVGEVVK